MYRLCFNAQTQNFVLSVFTIFIPFREQKAIPTQRIAFFRLDDGNRFFEKH